MTMAKTVTCLLPFKARSRICVYFCLTKDAEPIKAEINLITKRCLNHGKTEASNFSNVISKPTALNAFSFIK